VAGGEGEALALPPPPCAAQAAVGEAEGERVAEGGSASPTPPARATARNRAPCAGARACSVSLGSVALIGRSAAQRPTPEEGVARYSPASLPQAPLPLRRVKVTPAAPVASACEAKGGAPAAAACAALRSGAGGAARASTSGAAARGEDSSRRTPAVGKGASCAPSRQPAPVSTCVESAQGGAVAQGRRQAAARRRRRS
jgi:hypothetical protein